MSLHAVLRDGREVSLDPSYGETVEDLVDAVSRGNLTGSAMPLAEVKVRTTDGEEVSYSDINTFAEDSDFLGRETR